MTDRKTLFIVILFLVLMLAPSVWRVTLLDNWTLLPRFKNSGEPISPVSSLVLLIPSAGYLFVYARLSLRTALGKGPEKDFQPYRARNAFLLAGFGLALLMAQTYLIARSFGGAALLNNLLFLRFYTVFLGLIGIVASNQAPKRPWLRSRVRLFDLDPDTGARALRFGGYAGVTTGIAIIAVALLAPENLFMRAMMGVCILSVVMGSSITIWTQIKHRRISRLQANQ